MKPIHETIIVLPIADIEPSKNGNGHNKEAVKAMQKILDVSHDTGLAEILTEESPRERPLELLIAKRIAKGKMPLPAIERMLASGDEEARKATEGMVRKAMEIRCSRAANADLCRFLSYKPEIRETAMKELAIRIANGRRGALCRLDHEIGEFLRIKTMNTMIVEKIFQTLGEHGGAKSIPLLLKYIEVIPPRKEHEQMPMYRKMRFGLKTVFWQEGEIKANENPAVAAVIKIARRAADVDKETAEKAAAGLRLRGYLMSADEIFENKPEMRMLGRLTASERIRRVGLKIAQDLRYSGAYKKAQQVLAAKH